MYNVFSKFFWRATEKFVLSHSYLPLRVGLTPPIMALTNSSPQAPEPGPFDKRVPPIKPMPYQCHWTPDKRTYVAIQPLPNRGAMVYMAVAEKPELGWEFPGGDGRP